ncbi:SRPBCC family protein [Dactylosporangium sp. CA-139066]|uniref:SRPBCC family protein n=1 Tax=Dactylosporangium sp. CA-139066 TaxID=3239930 RepID=UPI003D919D7D
MWAYEHSVDSGASAAAIWDVWADVPGWPDWNAGVEKIEIDGEFAPGTRFRMTPPGEEAIELRLTEVVRHERFTDIMDAGDFVVTTVHRLEPLPGGGTRVVYRTEITGAAAAEVGPQLGPAITGDFPEVLAALVKRAEG